VALTNSKDTSVVDAADAKTEEEEEEEDIAETDPMLQEAGHILADQIRLLAKPTSKHMMVRSQKVDK
jgi:carboxyl-terminal processing protease